MQSPEAGQQPEATPEVRVGVYVCHCGGNISDVVDVAAVVEAVAGHPQVKVARNAMFMCSDPGQKLIIDDVLAKGVNRIVVAACSPTLHQLTFRKALERAGLNPYLYEHVNIREQCSWVHKQDHEGATAKALRLTLAGVEKVARQDPLAAIQVHATKHVVVIGGGVAGMSAALALARQQIPVTLVEQADSLGGRTAELDTVYPTEEKASELLGELASAVQAEPNIRVHLGSRVEQVDGFVGNFTVRVGNPRERETSAQTSEIRAGALILATGFDPYRPLDGEFGFGQTRQVVTLPEFQKLLADTPPDARSLVLEGRKLGSVAFIHCVGSRQVEGVHPPQADGRVNDYCSRVCCTATLHAAGRLLDRFPETQVYDLYKDIRTYGRGHEEYYEAASRKGVLFFRYNDDDLPRFEPAGEGTQGHALKVVDWLTWGEEVTIPVDLVVLATGMVPRDISSLTGMLKLPTGTDRFLQEVHPKLRPVELARNGVFLAGTCQGPMDITESCAAAQAAAVKASILLGAPTIQLDPYVARVEAGKCDGCERCLPECSYKGALVVEGGAAVVNPALCVGCGACVAVCPHRAINLAGWTLDQFDAQIDAITGAIALTSASGAH